MKQIIIQLKIIFCLIFAILFLTLTATVYGQEKNTFLSAPSLERIKSHRESFINYINEIEYDFKQHSSNFWKNSSRGKFDGMLYKYKLMIKEEDDILSYTRAIEVADKDAIDIIVYNKYLANDSYKMLKAMRLEDEIVFDKLRTLLEFIENKSSLKYENFLTSGKLLGIKKEKEFENCIKYFQSRFDENFYKGLQKGVDRYNREVYDKMRSFFRGAIKPADIMEYAYKTSILPQEKAGIKLILEARNSDISLSRLIKSIRAYLTEFGTKVKNIKYYPISSLTNKLEEMNFAERTQYVDEIAELKPGSKNFMKDFERLDLPTKRYVSKSITKGFWVLAGLGAVTTAAYITDVAAENHFNTGYTISNRDLATAGKKIENGTATIKEKFDFFTHPTTEEYIKTDPVYTLNFVQLASDIYAADKLLETLKSQEQQTQDNVENSLLRNLDRQMSKTDFGVGTL